jgi:hypothetical protein
LSNCSGRRYFGTRALSHSGHLSGVAALLDIVAPAFMLPSGEETVAQA